MVERLTLVCFILSYVSCFTSDDRCRCNDVTPAAAVLVSPYKFPCHSNPCKFACPSCTIFSIFRVPFLSLSRSRSRSRGFASHISSHPWIHRMQSRVQHSSPRICHNCLSSFSEISNGCTWCTIAYHLQSCGFLMHMVHHLKFYRS